MEETNLAVLIDFENIAAGTEKEGLGRFDVNALMARVKEKGRILIARSYADWGRFSRFKQALLTCNVTMMELTSHGMQDKNRADIAMVVDTLELAFTKDYIETFVIVSGDSDFTPMVLKMRELNKRIIGIGTRKSTSRLLIQACDEFIFYDSIVQAKRPPSRRRSTSSRNSGNLNKALDLLEDALAGLQRENPDPVHASVVKTAMLRKSPDFNENELGYPSFARFLNAAQDAGIIRVDRDTKSGGFRVHPTEDRDQPANHDQDEPDTTAGPWADAYLPKGSERVLAVLEQAKLPLLSAAVRKDVLGAMEDTIAERKKRRRKITLGLVREDMLKDRLRRTHPELPSNMLKSLFDGLMLAGELIHRDGTAIRSSSASFHTEKDAKGLNDALVQLYLAHLVDVAADVRDTQMLAELFYGDADRKREIEETVAWLHTAKESGDDDGVGRIDFSRIENGRSDSGRSDSGRSDSGRSDSGRSRDAARPSRNESRGRDDNRGAKSEGRGSRDEGRSRRDATADLDLDDLLLMDSPPPKKDEAKKAAPAAKKEESAEKAEPAKKAPAKAAEDAPAEEEPPKRRRTRRKKVEPADDADESAEAPEAEAKPAAKKAAAKPAAKAAAKPAAKKATAKPAAKAKADESADDEEKPKRRRTRKKKDEDDGDDDDLDSMLKIS